MSSSKKTRRHYTTKQKVAILKRHMVDKVPVSDLCNELELQPSVFYQWQRQVFENLAGAFGTPAIRTRGRPHKRNKPPSGSSVAPVVPALTCGRSSPGQSPNS